MQTNVLKSDKSFFKNYWLLITFILLIQTGIFVAVSYEQFIVLGIVIMFVMFIYLVFMMKNYVLILIALIPASQAIPIPSGGKEIGLFPDYILIPLLFFLMMNRRILKKDFVFLKTGLAVPGLLFIAISSASTFYAMTIFGISRCLPGIGNIYAFILAFMLFILMLDYLKEEDQIKKLIYYFMLSSLFMSIVGIIQYMMVSQNFLGVYRVTSLFDNILSKKWTGSANTLGTYLMFMTIIAISFRNFYSKSKKIVIYLTIIANITVLIMTVSRSSLIGLFVAIILIGLWREKRMLLWLIPFFMGVVGAVIASPRMISRLLSIVEIVFNPKVYKIFSRLNLKYINWSYVDYYGFAGYKSDVVAGAARFSAWVNSISTFMENPILGIGMQMSVYYFKWPTAENFILDILVWTGSFGFLIMCIIIYKLYTLSKKAMKHAETKFEKTFSSMYFAIFVSIIVVSITGSVMLSLKLLLIFALLTAINCKIALKEKLKENKDSNH